MALYWPEERVALEVVDDMDSIPFTGPSDVRVIRVTSSDLHDPDSMGDVVDLLFSELGEEVPEEPFERERALRDVMARATEA